MRPTLACDPPPPAALSDNISPSRLSAPREDLSLRNNGIPDLVATLMLVMFAVVSRRLEKETVAAIDTAQQTPQDYTGKPLGTSFSPRPRSPDGLVFVFSPETMSRNVCATRKGCWYTCICSFWRFCRGLTPQRARACFPAFSINPQQPTRNHSNGPSKVCVHSPPRAAGHGESEADLYDPDTYYRKFGVYGEIVFITVSLKNGNLMKVGAGGWVPPARKTPRENCRRGFWLIHGAFSKEFPATVVQRQFFSSPVACVI